MKSISEVSLALKLVWSDSFQKLMSANASIVNLVLRHCNL